MSVPLLELKEAVEFEGTVEEIQARLADFAGQRLHVIVQPAQLPDTPPDAAPCPLEAALQAIWKQVPDASWNQFPQDYGDNLDHYLYGTSRQK